MSEPEKRYPSDRISKKGLIKLYQRSYDTLQISHNGAAHKRLIQLEKEEHVRKCRFRH